MDRFPPEQQIERRRLPRICESFPVKVRGEDADAERFDIDAVLDNIGSAGLYLRLPRKVELGANLLVVVRLSSSQDRSVFAPNVAIHGEVLRAEPQPNGRFGVAVGFNHPGFL